MIENAVYSLRTPSQENERAFCKHGSVSVLSGSFEKSAIKKQSTKALCIGKSVCGGVKEGAAVHDLTPALMLQHMEDVAAFYTLSKVLCNFGNMDELIGILLKNDQQTVRQVVHFRRSPCF